ncbi:MAG TPA: C25 family cysteine peptidase [Chloroflexia bacterium]|nr:C25 family cysteine peptidase [Chloroflexia bacterium]
MSNIQSSKNILETTLYDGATLVSMLLRIGNYAEAASLASQLLIHFPQALPLHVGVGRALSAEPDQGNNTLRALGHLRRVLDSDPENWRIRLETALLYLRGGESQLEKAGQELWLAVMTAPDNLWLREMVDRLPDYPYFRRIQQWNKALSGGEQDLNALNPRQMNQDEGGLARLYLRRKMPWMAVQYFEAASKRVPANPPRLDLKTGLLLALWLNGEAKRASALASDMLLDQPQLLLPRLLLTGHLAAEALKKKPEALTRLIEPVWVLDPFLERSAELVHAAKLSIPVSLWPRSAQPATLANMPGNLRPYPNTGQPVQLRLGKLDHAWLESLLAASHSEDTQALASGGRQRVYHPLSEISYALSDLDGLLVDIANRKPGENSSQDEKLILPKGRPTAPRQPDPELDKIAESIAQVEELLFGISPTRRKPARPPARKNQSGAARRPQPKGGFLNRSSAKSAEKIAPVTPSPDPANEYPISASLFNTKQVSPGKDDLRQAFALVISSEKALISKYGQEGFRRIKTLLSELVGLIGTQGYNARLLLVDSAEALRQNGFGRLDPVSAGSPEQIRELINAALPQESAEPSTLYPDTVFIVGGPEIIPFWKLPNPSFDSDRELLSDNPYGARDQTYLLPERIVGRLPDDGGARGAANLGFFLKRLEEVVQRQRERLLPHSVLSSLPLRLMETVLPAALRLDRYAVDDRMRFEQEWLYQTQSSGEIFLDKARASYFTPFFYSAEAWKQSSETLRNFMSGQANLVFSPPARNDSLDSGLLQQSRLLHFNLHGFRDSPNWYGQSHASRLVTTPSLSALPLAFTPKQAGQVRKSGSVVFSEACYGGYLAGKSVDESIALSLLGQGAAAVVGSSAISYGAAGPELTCAGHLSYYFWREALVNGSSFGRALQAAKITYARERLAAGHNLTGDDAKTLLEFMLLGDPTIGIANASPAVTATAPGVDRQAILSAGVSGNLQKGGLRLPGQIDWEELGKLHGMMRRFWNRLVQPKAQYQPVEYSKLPPDLQEKIERILAWLLPDPVPPEGPYLQALIDMGSDYQSAGQSFSSGNNRRHRKGGDSSGFADWFLEEPEHGEKSGGELSQSAAFRGGEAQLLLSGQRLLRTSDGLPCPQTFHLTTDFSGEAIEVKLTRGIG